MLLLLKFLEYFDLETLILNNFNDVHDMIRSNVEININGFIGKFQTI